MRRQRPPLPSEIEDVRDRVEIWRKTRRKRSPMPEPLWEAAVALARKHGVYAIARDLQVNYKSLKSKTAQASGEGRGAESRQGGFVELSAAQLLGGSSPPGPVVEITDGDGAHLTIHLRGQDDLDVPGVVDAFWRRQA